MQSRPFQQEPFAEIPDRPRKPHPYFRTETRYVRVHSAPFGRLRVHYRTCGEGPPLLLIHGLMTSSYSWRYVLEDLGAHFRLVVPDLPGCGRSDKPTNCDYGPGALATWIGEFQKKLGIHGCAAVGNSLGGYLCMRRALERTSSFSALVNIHSPAFPELRLHALHRALALPGMKALLAWWVRGESLRWAHGNVHYYDESLKSMEEAGEYGGLLATSEGSHAFVRYLAETLDPDEMGGFVHRLARRREQELGFPIPLLLMYATRDPMVSPAMGERLHRLIPDAEIVWLDKSSHFAQVDSPERVVPILLRFLQGRAGDQAPGVHMQ